MSNIDQVEFREATVADVARLVAFSRRTFNEFFGADDSAENMRAYLDASFTEALQAREVEDANTRVVLAVDGADFVGYTTVVRSAAPEVVTRPHAIQLHRFYVDTPWHGSGLANRLMAAVDSAARSLDGTHVWLAVWEHNPRAIRYYSKQGFADVGTMPFTLGNELQTDRVLVREVIA